MKHDTSNNVIHFHTGTIDCSKYKAGDTFEQLVKGKVKSVDKETGIRVIPTKEDFESLDDESQMEELKSDFENRTIDDR